MYFLSLTFVTVTCDKGGKFLFFSRILIFAFLGKNAKRRKARKLLPLR